MEIFRDRKTEAPVRFVVFSFLSIVCGAFVLLSVINWLFFQDNAFYQRPSVAASSLHALRRMISVVLNPAWSLPDSWAPMLAAYDVLISSGAAIYQETFFKTGIRFQYPPSALLVIDFLNALDVQPQLALQGMNVFFFLMIALTSSFIAVACFEKIYSSTARDKICLYVIGFLLPFFFYPIIHALNMGQVQIWIDAFICMSVLAWLKERKTMAGAMAGLTCLFKPQASLLLLWSVAARDWHFVRGFAIVVFSLSLIHI